MAHAGIPSLTGDADDEEHIKLARVLQTILHFSPEDILQVRSRPWALPCSPYLASLCLTSPHLTSPRQVNEKIEYYEASWWHRTANLLKTDSAATAGAPASGSWFSSWWGAAGAEAPPRGTTALANPQPRAHK